jgi:ADP-ribose pyrophosphatase
VANIFLYGTLCDLELLQICLGRSLDKIDKQPARLDNHSVFWVKGRNFPVIKFVEGASAQGIVLFDLSNDDLNRLDFYEGSFNIENKQLSDHTDMVEAQVYFNTDEKIEVGDQWSLRNWQTEFGDVSRRVAIEFMQLHNLSNEIDLLMEYENIYSRVFKN